MTTLTFSADSRKEEIMGLFMVNANCAPGFQYSGLLYQPGDTVVIPMDEDGKWAEAMAFSLGGDNGKTKVFDKLTPLDDEALVMSGKKPAK
jgi:hypothetical protein